LGKHCVYVQENEVFSGGTLSARIQLNTSPRPGYDLDQPEGKLPSPNRLQGRAPVTVYEDDFGVIDSPQFTEMGKAFIDVLLLFVHRDDD
jgi:hypothetical protein